MAYAFCPNCRVSFRYRVETPHGPAWLKELARSAGRGEQAAVLCYGCWVPLRVGGMVRILHPPYSKPEIRSGVPGMVVDITTQDDGVTVYDIDGIEELDGCIWRHTFTRRQIKAEEPHASDTTRLNLPPSR